MAELSGGTYLVSGLIVALVSIILTITGRRFYLFMIIGVIMVIIGFLKLASKKPRKPIQKLYCPKCSAQLRKGFNYCYNCGIRIK